MNVELKCRPSALLALLSLMGSQLTHLQVSRGVTWIEDMQSWDKEELSYFWCTLGWIYFTKCSNNHFLMIPTFFYYVAIHTYYLLEVLFMWLWSGLELGWMTFCMCATIWFNYYILLLILRPTWQILIQGRSWNI